MTKNGFAAVALIAVLFASVFSDAIRADTDENEFRHGLSAFNAGDYTTALALWRPLAERGEPRAEAGLGFMYHRGQGVAVDDRQAAIWLQRAADQGQAEGQLMLGILFYYGRGVGQSFVRAYAWCELAEINGNGDAGLCRDAALESMTDAERDVAFRLAVELRERQARRR